jgi:hypothetical protein
MTTTSKKKTIKGEEMITLTAEPMMPAPLTTPNQMLAMVVSRGGSMEEIQKFMDLQDRWDAKVALQAYIEAKARFKRECPAIKKNKNVSYNHKDGNGHTSYNYAEIGFIGEATKEALGNNGLTVDWILKEIDGGKISVQCVVSHSGGHVHVGEPLTAAAETSGKKNDIQSKGSTITFLERYTMIATLGLTISDGSDDDGRSHLDQSPEDGHYTQAHPAEPTPGVKTKVTSDQYSNYIDAVMDGKITLKEIEDNHFLDIKQRKALETTEASYLKSKGNV